MCYYATFFNLCENIFTFIWWFVKLYLLLSLDNLKRNKMELFELNRLKVKLNIGDSIDMFSIDDCATVSKNKREEFIFELNGKVILIQKSFRTFRDKLIKIVEERGLFFAEEFYSKNYNPEKFEA